MLEHDFTNGTYYFRSRTVVLEWPQAGSQGLGDLKTERMAKMPES